ncbi:MAG: Rpp14/Pop5 family protein [Candidatus Bathyarchaeia archaeon]
MPIKMKCRYLALKIDSNENFSSKELMDAIWEALLRLFGEYGASKIGLTLIDCYTEKRLAIVRVAHTEVEKLRAALASITKIAKPAAVHVMAVSGTLRALRKKIKS